MAAKRLILGGLAAGLTAAALLLGGVLTDGSAQEAGTVRVAPVSAKAGPRCCRSCSSRCAPIPPTSSVWAYSGSHTSSAPARPATRATTRSPKGSCVWPCAMRPRISSPPAAWARLRFPVIAFVMRSRSDDAPSRCRRPRHVATASSATPWSSSAVTGKLSRRSTGWLPSSRASPLTRASPMRASSSGTSAGRHRRCVSRSTRLWASRRRLRGRRPSSGS